MKDFVTATYSRHAKTYALFYQGVKIGESWNYRMHGGTFSGFGLRMRGVKWNGKRLAVRGRVGFTTTSVNTLREAKTLALKTHLAT